MVSLSSRSPIRESPRLLVAGVLLGICLIVIGLGIGLAISSGGSTSPASHTVRVAQPSGASVSQLRQTVAADAASLRIARGRVNDLQTRLSLSQRQTAHKIAALRRSRRAARCWRAKALHPQQPKSATCP